MENDIKNTSPSQTQNNAHQSGNVQGSHHAGSQPQGGKAASGKSSQQTASDKGGLSEISGKLQQLCSATAEKVSNLSTTQKVVGGSVLALGAGWIAMNSMNKKERMRENVRKRN